MSDRLVALDTEVLLAIEAETPDCSEAHRLLREVGFLFAATPTVMQELETARHKYQNEYTQALAENLLSRNTLRELGVTSPRLNDTEIDVSEIHARTMMERNILDGASHANEGDIIALIEAAYKDCPLFVTTNSDLLERADSLSLALVQICGMRALLIVSPSEVIEAFKTP